ncbi:MAG TPA: MFS transporter, partial [Acidimicrobiales bacterium]|nr:MFS transporter [Acidimicrobiales bacterium]
SWHHRMQQQGDDDVAVNAEDDSSAAGPQGAAAPATGRERQRTFASLRHRDFTVFWSAAIVSNTGSTMQMFTIPYVIFTLTHSTTWLGFSAAIAFVPNVVVGPIGGALADRCSRRAVLLVTQSVQMVAAVALWIVWISGDANVWTILGVMFVSSVAGGLGISSWQAFVPSLVPRQDLMNAVRLNSIQFTVARSGGPVLAALVLTQIGAGAAFLGNALTYLPVLAALLSISVRARPERVDDHSVARQFADGLAYVRRHPSLFQCIANILVLSALAYAIVQLAPAVAHNQFHGGKSGYGILVSAYGIGSVASSFAVARFGDRVARSTTTTAGIVVAIVAMGLLGAASETWLGAVAFFGIGIAQTIIAITHNTTIQVQVTDAFRGRVLSVYLMAVQLGLPLGALVLGAVAAHTGTRVLSLAVTVLLVAYLVFVRIGFGGMRGLDSDEQFADDSRR